MIFGGVAEDRLQLNADTLTSEEPGTSDLPLRVTGDFDQVETMLRQRQFAEAGDVITKHWTGRSWPCYQPMSDLYLRFDQHGGTPLQYLRELDLRTAISVVKYKTDDVAYTREYFASNPDGLIAVRVAASVPGKLSFKAALSSVQLAAREEAVTPDQIVLKGQVPGFALRCTLQRVEARGEQWKYPEIWDKNGKRRPQAKAVLYGGD